MEISRQFEQESSRACAPGRGRVRRQACAAGIIVITAFALGALPSAAGAAQFTQCPPVGMDTGCQFLIEVTDQGPSVQQDTSQGPFEGEGDVLVGITNNSSRVVQSIQLSATNGFLFKFDGDGLCNNGKGPAPAGCQAPPGSSVSCNPSTADTNHCSFPPPPGEPAGYTEPGASNYSEEHPPNTAVPPPWPNGTLQNGYEGPRSWYSNVSPDFNSGTVNFSPPLAPGESTYFSLEDPLANASAVVDVPTAGTSITTSLAGDGLLGTNLVVPERLPVTDSATIAGAGAASAGGTVTYRVYSDKACTKPVFPPSSATVSNGIAGPSAPITIGYGQYYMQASYTGDAANSPSASACGSERLFFAKRFSSGLPPTRICLGRKLSFRLRNPKGVKTSIAQVDINGKLIRRLHVGKRRVRIMLTQLPAGSFHIEVIETDTRGRVVEDSRLYRRCGK